MKKLAHRGGPIAMPLLFIALMQCTNAAQKTASGNDASKRAEPELSHPAADIDLPPIPVGADWLEYYNKAGGFAMKHPRNVKATTRDSGAHFEESTSGQPGVFLMLGEAISPESPRYGAKLARWPKFIAFLRSKPRGPFGLNDTPFKRFYYGASSKLTKRRNLSVAGINAVQILSFKPAPCKGPIPLPGGAHADCFPFSSDGASVFFMSKGALWIIDSHTPNPGGTRHRLPLFDAMVSTFRFIDPEADPAKSKQKGRLVQFGRGPHKRQLRRMISRSSFVALAKMRSYGRIAPPGLPRESERHTGYFQVRERDILKGKRLVAGSGDDYIVKAELEPEIGRAIHNHYSSETLVLFFKRPSRRAAKSHRTDTPLYRIVDRLHGVALMRSIEQSELWRLLPAAKRKTLR